MTTGATPVGDYVSSEKTWYATETGTTSVVFTNDNTKRIGGMVVYLYDIMERIYDVLGEKGIQIPFPQRDVHIIS